MAAASGAGKVTACELFPALCEVAEQTIAENSLNDRISVVPLRSSDLRFGFFFTF